MPELARYKSKKGVAEQPVPEAESDQLAPHLLFSPVASPAPPSPLPPPTAPTLLQPTRSSRILPCFLPPHRLRAVSTLSALWSTLTLASAVDLAEGDRVLPQGSRQVPHAGDHTRTRAHAHAHARVTRDAHAHTHTHTARSHTHAHALGRTRLRTISRRSRASSAPSRRARRRVASR